MDLLYILRKWELKKREHRFENSLQIKTFTGADSWLSLQTCSSERSTRTLQSTRYLYNSYSWSCLLCNLWIELGIELCTYNVQCVMSKQGSIRRGLPIAVALANPNKYLLNQNREGRRHFTQTWPYAARSCRKCMTLSICILSNSMLININTDLSHMEIRRLSFIHPGTNS